MDSGNSTILYFQNHPYENPFFWAIIGVFIWIAFKVFGAMKKAATTAKCPRCSETIKADATVCKHCHSAIGDQGKAA